MFKSLVFAAGAFAAGLASSAVAEDFDVRWRPFPEIRSADGSFSGRVMGIAQLDAAFNLDDSFDHPTGSTLRRARLGVNGTVYGKFDYFLDFEFGNGASGSVNDAFVRYKPDANWSFWLGQYKDPTSFDFFSPLPHRAFQDQALSRNLAPGRKLGFSVQYADKHWGVQGHVFGENVERRRSDDEGYSFTGRLNFAPINEKGQVLHIGGAINWEKVNDETRSVRYRGRHETSSTSFRSIDTGAITDAESVLVVNADIVGIAGPTWILAEYTNSKVNRSAGLFEPSFDGWYVKGGWVLTGETRSYSTGVGLGGVRPNKTLLDGGNGAFEIALRYDTLDLNEGPITGGKMDRYSANFIWYPFDYVQVRASLQAGNTDALAPIPNDKPKAVQLRFQWQY